jgi:hypothetical protein
VGADIEFSPGKKGKKVGLRIETESGRRKPLDKLICVQMWSLGCRNSLDETAKTNWKCCVRKKHDGMEERLDVSTRWDYFVNSISALILLNAIRKKQVNFLAVGFIGCRRVLSFCTAMATG